MGLVLSRAGRADDAAADLQKAADLAPDDWRQHDTFGDFLVETGKFDEARKQLEAAVQLTPDNTIAITDLARVAMRQSRYDEAQKLFERAAAITPSFDVLTGLGTAFMLEGQYPKALDAFARATRLNSKSYLGWANLGAAAAWSPGQVAKAAEAYGRAVAAAEAQKALTPNDPVLLASLGGYYAALEIPDKAFPLLRQAVALDSNSPDVTYLVGEAYEILRRRDDALKWIGAAIKLGYSIDYVRRSPELAGLRADPRYRNIDRAAQH
jgi:tetratricopeptide (TPR) repeat protein